ncbi:unnamed protein product [Vitrella brassicaformis CCMP3155]|uniref:Pyridine nucleotide-disulphide oxidoreductase dimerisation domain-containing protein n=1 Tax=Vitrella brassicaformis (strain CCMP3155) TaxID=1169540 RepID=A0A0G4FWC9_VITBC|nr:unnamed protein product [Vitrella brassicaformis CCMP3155]|eukprot:CEM19428.1 unnamed protein product [Vitrella brassicaformis CCMP3155]
MKSPIFRRLLSSSASTAASEATAAGSRYDLCIVGGGAAGFAAAVRAWDFGRKVCLVNKGPLGGASLAAGALSSKVMWQLSRQFRHLQSINKRYHPDVQDAESTRTYQHIKTSVGESVDFKRHHFEMHLAGLSKRMRYSAREDGGGGMVDWQEVADAKFLDKHRLGVRGPEGHEGVIEAEHFLIATGSRPRELPSIPVYGKYVVTSDHLLSFDQFPKRLMIIGAGVIGCEFAAIFGNFGFSQVHLINERRPRLLPQEDEDLAAFITSNFAMGGVHIHNNVKVIGVDIDEAKQEVEVTIGVLPPSPSDDQPQAQPQTQEFIEEKKIRVDKVLLSVGRVPNTDTLALEKAGVTLGSGGALEVEKKSLAVAGAPHISAAGDVTVDVGLVSVAEMEARYAVEMMFGHKNPATPLNYHNVSSIMFLRPEVACVGMNESEARRRQIAHKVATLRLDVVNRAVIDWNLSHDTGRVDPDRCGFVKMIVTDDDYKKLLGMRAVGVDASAVIQSAALLIAQGDSVRYLEGVLHPHPAITEGVLEVCRLLSGRSIYKPHIFDACRVTHFSRKEGIVHAKEKRKRLVPSYMGDEA